MRVLFITSELGFGGAERTTQCLANSFANKDGNEIAILLYSDHVGYEIDSRVRFFEADLYHVDSQLCLSNFIKKIVNRVKLNIYPKKVINEWKPDVVVSLIAEAAEWVVGYCNRHDIRLVVSERSNPEFTPMRKMLLRKKVMRQSDIVIFQTEAARMFYESDIQKKGIVIPNAVGNELAYKLHPWNLAETNKEIAAVGRFTWEKDYKTLINAFELIHKQFPDYTLIIWGEGKEKADIAALIGAKGLSEYVEISLPHRNALCDVRKAKCYVLSSISEGMPNSLIEAMALGMPCVSTRCHNGPEEIIENGVNGLLVDVSDYRQLSEAVVRIISDDSLAQELGKNARKVIDTNNIDIIADRYLKVIEGNNEFI